MDLKRKKCGFTLVELLTSLAIIAMLIGLLIPALNTVRNFSKKTKQKAQLITIGLALATFKNDYDGEYPPSDWHPITSIDYCGAQKLAEALLGWDLMGFHPKSAWRADGYDGGLSIERWLTYDPGQRRDFDGDGILDTLNERRGCYLELATTNAFRLGNNPARQQDPDGLFDDPTPLERNTFVICDVFGVRRIRVGQKTVKAGTPILYYKANTSSKTFAPPATVDQRIYNALDNQRLVELKSVTADGSLGRDHPLGYEIGMDYPVFYDEQFNYGAGIGYGIRNPKITAWPWPYRPDSYILISAGADGEYGTNDDIRNFGK